MYHKTKSKDSYLKGIPEFLHHLHCSKSLYICRL